MRIVILLLMILSVSSEILVSQNVSSDPYRPKWFQKLPTPTNATFKYEIHTAIAPTLDEAREKCLFELVSDSGLKNGILAMSDGVSKQSVSQEWVNGKLHEQVDYNSTTNLHLQSEVSKLYVEVVDEFWEMDRAGNYVLSRLYAVSASDVPPLFDNLSLTTNYGARAMWKSLIIPGWGQFSKGQKLKGGMILGGTALLVGGIVATENIRADYRRRVNETHDVAQRRDYIRRVDRFSTARNVCIGAVGALYVYNLVDAIVSPGARRVVVKSKGRDALNCSYNISPALYEGKTLAMEFSLTF